MHNGYAFYKHRMTTKGAFYWVCTKKGSCKCRAKVYSMQIGTKTMVKVINGEHFHPPAYPKDWNFTEKLTYFHPPSHMTTLYSYTFAIVLIQQCSKYVVSKICAFMCLRKNKKKRIKTNDASHRRCIILWIKFTMTQIEFLISSQKAVLLRSYIWKLIHILFFRIFFFVMFFLDVDPRALGFYAEAKFTLSNRGKYKLLDDRYELLKHHTAKGATYWMCAQRIKLNCKGKCYTKAFNGHHMIKHIANHNHWHVHRIVVHF